MRIGGGWRIYLRRALKGILFKSELVLTRKLQLKAGADQGFQFHTSLYIEEVLDTGSVEQGVEGVAFKTDCETNQGSGGFDRNLKQILLQPKGAFQNLEEKGEGEHRVINIDVFGIFVSESHYFVKML